MTRSPFRLQFRKAAGGNSDPTAISNFTSYSFERNVQIPASAFRFTAPGVDKSARVQIRSGDEVQIIADTISGSEPVGTGFIDETDTHITANSVEYVLTGRDVLGQLVDNAAVDDTNTIIRIEKAGIRSIMDTLLRGTRVPRGVTYNQCPNGQFLFQTNPGETKINALQRILEFSNCLIWTKPNGQVVVGKPTFAQDLSGRLILSSSDPRGNNVLEGRSRRNTNQAIRKIVTQLQPLGTIAPDAFTMLNNDSDVRPLASSKVGRSVYRLFSYGSGEDVVNQVNFIGNQSADYRLIGQQLSLREIAKENVKVLDVEVVVVGHTNDSGKIYNIDQIYDVFIEDDDVQEPMYVHQISYEMTKDLGAITRMHLCRVNTIVAGAYAFGVKK